MLDYILPAVILGFLLDLVFGDPVWLYHPVRIIGKLITFFEKLLRALFPKTKAGERTAGVLLVIFVTGISTAVPLLLLRLLYGLNVFAGFALETFWCYQLLATKALKVESMRVFSAVKSGDLEKSRYAVSMIVGRDTKELSFEGVTKAAVETVAENASDGVVAPLLFLMIGGAAGGFFYKSINTMDSMVGYKNDRYRYFGTFAARLDDVVNFLPARLAGCLMIFASGLCGMDQKNAWKIYRRDRKKHASPNSAHTEAVMAGALDIQLAGDAWYFGKLHKKPTLGDPIRPVEAEDIPRANRLMPAGGGVRVGGAGAARILCLFLFRAAGPLF
mgnify:FL=1